MMGNKLLYVLAVFVFPILACANWNVEFDESAQTLSLKRADISIDGTVSFESEGKKWKIGDSRDA